MKTTTRKTGTIWFRTPVQKMLWDVEISGQLSDGHWENARPLDHWEFWCMLDSEVGEPGVVTDVPWKCKKSRYGLSGLIKYVGPRMVNIAKLVLAGGNEEACRGAEYMPETYEQWAACKDGNSWKYDFIADYMEYVDHQTAREFYGVKYTEKQLRADLKEIRNVMRTMDDR